MTDDRRLAFIKIAVADLDAQSRFYAEVFGLSEWHRISGDGFEEIVLAAAAGPSLVLVWHARHPAAEPDGTVLGFDVADIEETVRAAEAAGGTVQAGPRTLPGACIRTAVLRDPGGYRVELVQQP